MLDSILTTPMTIVPLMICFASALLLGLGVAAVYMYRTQYTKSFAVTIALLPLMTVAIIMVVNGNLGTGVAVMGAFSLVRFRSVPGSAREICAIFFAMALGLCIGAGYVVIALILFALVGGMMTLLNLTAFGEKGAEKKELKISIPESLDYEGLFDDLIKENCAQFDLTRVRTTNMGALYELTYVVKLKKGVSQKAFMDGIRCRNGNLGVALGRVSGTRDEL